ncbi:hypothetical protein GE061_003822 [Apolygus lucorum]|uniref:Uncharacterized protein n=1 Tax=Apolygus lucorum TaxID=248454 RepID=A0A6A4JRC4_APOLU|nr:hypothetical protein GE061_003822 [Apolygus lucorum]
MPVREIESYLFRKLSRSNSRSAASEMGEEAKVGQLTLGELMTAIKEALPTKDDFFALNAEVQSLKQENIKLREELNTLQTNCIKNADTIEFLLNKSKENNLIFRGIPSETDAEPSKIVTKLLVEVLKINEHIKINKAFYIGPALRTRMILVVLASSSDKWIIFKNAKNLKGTKITVSQDFTVATREKRGKLFTVMNELKRRMGDGVHSFVRNNMLMVNKGRFYWHAEKGLITSNHLDGISELRSLTGEDLSEFVADIKSGKITRQSPGQSGSGAAPGGL